MLKRVEIKDIRKSLRLTQRDVARRIGVSSTMISQWEKGRRSLPQKRYEQIMSLVVPISSEEGQSSTPMFVRVSYKVETIAQILEKVQLHGEVVFQDGEDLYRITKIGGSK